MGFPEGSTTPATDVAPGLWVVRGEMADAGSGGLMKVLITANARFSCPADQLAGFLVRVQGYERAVAPG